MSLFPPNEDTRMPGSQRFAWSEKTPGLPAARLLMKMLLHRRWHDDSLSPPSAGLLEWRITLSRSEENFFQSALFVLPPSPPRCLSPFSYLRHGKMRYLRLWVFVSFASGTRNGFGGPLSRNGLFELSNNLIHAIFFKWVSASRSTSLSHHFATDSDSFWPFEFYFYPSLTSFCL